MVALLVCITATLAETAEDARAEMKCNQGSRCDQTEHDDEMSALQQSTAKAPVDNLPDDDLSSEEQEDDALGMEENDAIAEEDQPPATDFAGNAAEKFLETAAQYDQQQKEANRLAQAPPLNLKEAPHFSLGK